MRDTEFCSHFYKLDIFMLLFQILLYVLMRVPAIQ